MLDRKDLSRQVKRIIVTALQLDIDPADIGEDDLLFGEDLGAESVATLEIIFALEEEFDIEVGDEELRVELFDSVRTITRYLAQKLEEEESDLALV